MLEQKENSSNKTDPINLRRRQVPGLLHVQQRCTRSRNDTGRKKVMTLRKSHLKPDHTHRSKYVQIRLLDQFRWKEIETG